MMIKKHIALILLPLMCLLTACCSSVKFRVIDADTGKPIENAIIHSWYCDKPIKTFACLDKTDKNGELTQRNPTQISVAKEGYWISRDKEKSQEPKTYIIKMYKLENKFPIKTPYYAFKGYDKQLPEKGHCGIISSSLGITKPLTELSMTEKIDDPDWERLRQICVSANNQYKYLENQKKQNATKK